MTKPASETIRYYQWYYQQVPGAAEFGFLMGDIGELEREMDLGARVAPTFPRDAHFSMRADRPKDVMLIDNFMSQGGLFVVSPRLQDCLKEETATAADLELLPVSLVNHRGRIAATDYAIVHTCKVVDCIDQQKSQFKWNPINSAQMIVSSLVLDPSKLTAQDLLIRPRYISHLILVRQNLAEKLMQQGLTGLWMMVPSP